MRVYCFSESKLLNPVYNRDDLVRYPQNVILCTFPKAVEPSGGHKGDNTRVNQANKRTVLSTGQGKPLCTCQLCFHSENKKAE